MYLFINTTNENGITVELYNPAGYPTVSLNTTPNQHRSEQLLQTVDQVFQKAGWDREQAATEIKGIIVVRGPQGRFSAIRSGVVLANCFGFAWNVPVVGIETGGDIAQALEQIKNQTKFTESVIPVYEKGPHIG